MKEEKPGSKEEGQFRLCSDSLRAVIPLNCDKDINQKHHLAAVLQFQKHSTVYFRGIASKMYYLINSFLKKVKIVEAVYFANILNQSCFEFFRHQKAALLNEPPPLPALGWLWGSELHITIVLHSFIHSFSKSASRADN